jgi:hypothetical protein
LVVSVFAIIGVQFRVPNEVILRRKPRETKRMKKSRRCSNGLSAVWPDKTAFS